MARRMGGGVGAAEERPLSELFAELTNEVKVLISKEVELAKVETKKELSKAAKAGTMFGAAGVAAFLGVLLLAFAAAWGLAAVIPTGWAFLIVAMVFLGAAGILAARGRRNLADFNPVPERTLETLKDDVQVAKGSLARGASGTASAPWRR